MIGKREWKTFVCFFSMEAECILNGMNFCPLALFNGMMTQRSRGAGGRGGGMKNPAIEARLSPS